MGITKRGTDKLGKPIYQIEISDGTNPLTGKPLKYTESFHGTHRAARMREQELYRDLKDGLNLEKATMSFSEFAQEQLKIRQQSQDITDNTKDDDRYKTERLCTVLGDVRLCDIDARIIEEALLKLQQNPIRSDKPLSGTTMNALFKKLKQILDAAVRYDLIRKNPCSMIKAPKKDTKERNTLSLNQARRLREELIEELDAQYQALFEKEARQAKWGNEYNRSQIRGLGHTASVVGVYLALFLGLRHGELLGLQWADIDFGNRAIKINRALTQAQQLKSPKSAKGKREVFFDVDTGELLKRWKRLQATLLLKLKLPQASDTYVVCSDTGGQPGYNNLNRWWNEWKGSHRIGDYTLHELRHTCFTHMAANGTDLKSIQTLAGHADASTTANIYLHPVEEKQREASESVSALFSEPAKRTPIVPFKARNAI